MYKLICSCFGIGYLKGGGTVASLVCAGVMYLLRPAVPAPFPALVSLSIAVLLVALGIICANHVEKDWGKDSYRVVIDEVAGMWISMLFVPVTLPYLLLGLFLFRLFDITKPLYIRKLEKLPAGTGVMMDDVLAGVYSCLLIQVVIVFKLMPF